MHKRGAWSKEFLNKSPFKIPKLRNIILKASKKVAQYINK